MCKSKAEGGHRCTGEKRVRTKEEHAKLVLARRQRNALAASKQRAKRRSQQQESSSFDSRPPVRKTKALIAAEDKLALMQSSFDNGKCSLESLEMQRKRVDELYAKAKPLKVDDTTPEQGESSKKTDLTPDDRSEAVVAPDDSQQTTVNPFEKFLQEVDAQGAPQVDTQGAPQTVAQGAPQVETETTVNQQESSKKDKVVAPEKVAQGSTQMDAFDTYVDTMLAKKNAVGWTDSDGRVVLWKDALDALTPDELDAVYSAELDYQREFDLAQMTPEELVEAERVATKQANDDAELDYQRELQTLNLHESSKKTEDDFDRFRGLKSKNDAEATLKTMFRRAAAVEFMEAGVPQLAQVEPEHVRAVVSGEAPRFIRGKVGEPWMVAARVDQVQPDGTVSVRRMDGTETVVRVDTRDPFSAGTVNGIGVGVLRVVSSD